MNKNPSNSFNLVTESDMGGTASRAHWNVLTDRWLEVMDHDAKAGFTSPLEALSQASSIHRLLAASPLDLFAAHRFLLTLLYWQADAGGGVQAVRESLLRGDVPRAVLDAISREACRFGLFDERTPFLQDVSARDAKTKSAGSLFGELACGTNIAHFHHGDDENMRLCIRCATLGMLRVIPWSQSGGAGLTPSVHNAPPITAIALGRDLTVTLGLNLIPLDVDPGAARWTGHFGPSDRNGVIPNAINLGDDDS